MKVIELIDVDNTALVSSSVTEDDYAEWDESTDYVTDDYVIVIGTTHAIYQAADASGPGTSPPGPVDPTTDDGTYWTRIGATNRWKAFDDKIADKVEDTTAVEYEILTPSNITALAFLGLEAGSVTVTVKNTDSPASTVYDETTSLTDRSEITDWWTWFFAPVTYKTELILDGIPAYTGYTIDIAIGTSGETVKVGQVCLGNIVTLGETLPGTTLGIDDFSIKQRDDFGNAILLERDYADTITFEFACPTSDVRRVKRKVTDLRATPSIWLTDEDDPNLVFGYPINLNFPLTVHKTFGFIEIEGLI